MNPRLAQQLMAAIQAQPLSGSEAAAAGAAQPLGPGVLPSGSAQAMNDPELWLSRHRYARTHGRIPEWVSQDLAHVGPHAHGPVPQLPAPGTGNPALAGPRPGDAAPAAQPAPNGPLADVGRFAPHNPIAESLAALAGHRLPPIHPSQLAARAALGYS